MLLDTSSYLILDSVSIPKSGPKDLPIISPRKNSRRLRHSSNGVNSVKTFIREIENWLTRQLALQTMLLPKYRERVPYALCVVGYTETVDWWSMGVILFEMLVGYPPFASETPRETWFKIQNWRKYFCIPSDASVSNSAADLIR